MVADVETCGCLKLAEFALRGGHGLVVLLGSTAMVQSGAVLW